MASLLESFLAMSRAAVGIKGELDSFKPYKMFSRIFRRFFKVHISERLELRDSYIFRCLFIGSITLRSF